MTIRVRRADLEGAAAGIGLSPAQAEALWLGLDKAAAGRSRFDAVHVLYYVGALVVILGMVFLTATQWDTLSGLAITGIAAAYGAGFLAIGHWLWTRHEALRTPGGLFVVMAVGVTPIAVYGLQRQYGIWPFGEPGEYRDFHVWIRSGWFVMEVATILAAALAVTFYRFPFLTAPLAFTLWYLSMDLTPIVFAGQEFDWEGRSLVSMLFGLPVLALAYVIDLRSRHRDFAFWLYLAGLLAFWGGLSLMDGGSELSRFGYFLVNLTLVALAVFLRRRAFLLFGGVGVIGYVGDLSRRLFPDEILFTVALIAIGLLILSAGVWLARRRARIEAWVERSMPPALRRLRPG